MCLYLSSECVSSAQGDQASSRVSKSQQQTCRPAGTAHNCTVLRPGGEPCSREEPLNCRKSLFALEKRCFLKRKQLVQLRHCLWILCTPGTFASRNKNFSVRSPQSYVPFSAVVLSKQAWAGAAALSDSHKKFSAPCLTSSLGIFLWLPCWLEHNW